MRCSLNSLALDVQCACVGLVCTVLFGCSDTQTPPPPPPAPQADAAPARLLEIHVLKPDAVVLAEAARDDEYLTLIYTRAGSTDKYFKRSWMGSRELESVAAAGKIRVVDSASSVSQEVPCQIVDTNMRAFIRMNASDLREFKEITRIGLSREGRHLVVAGVDRDYKNLSFRSYLSEEMIRALDASPRLLVILSDESNPDQDGLVHGEYPCLIASNWDELQLLLLAN